MPLPLSRTASPLPRGSKLYVKVARSTARVAFDQDLIHRHLELSNREVGQNLTPPDKNWSISAA